MEAAAAAWRFIARATAHAQLAPTQLLRSLRGDMDLHTTATRVIHPTNIAKTGSLFPLLIEFSIGLAFHQDFDISEQDVQRQRAYMMIAAKFVDAADDQDDRDKLLTRAALWVLFGFSRVPCMHEFARELAAVILRRRLHADSSCLSTRAAATALLLLWWDDHVPSEVQQQHTFSRDWERLIVASEHAEPGTLLEHMCLSAQLLLMALGLQDYERQAPWLVPRLVGAIHRGSATGISAKCLGNLLQGPFARATARQPALLVELLDAGLVRALACCMAQGNMQLALLCAERLNGLLDGTDRDATVMGEAAAALSDSQALQAAAAGVFGFATYKALLMQPHEAVAVGWRAVYMKRLGGAYGKAARNPASAAALERVRRLRACAHCFDVEDVPRTFKSCAACKDRRTGAAALSSGTVEILQQYGAQSLEAYYCSRECQMADRFTGHAQSMVATLPDSGKWSDSLCRGTMSVS